MLLNSKSHIIFLNEGYLFYFPFSIMLLRLMKKSIITELTQTAPFTANLMSEAIKTHGSKKTSKLPLNFIN